MMCKLYSERAEEKHWLSKCTKAWLPSLAKVVRYQPWVLLRPFPASCIHPIPHPTWMYRAMSPLPNRSSCQMRPGPGLETRRTTDRRRSSPEKEGPDRDCLATHHPMCVSSRQRRKWHGGCKGRSGTTDLRSSRDGLGYRLSGGRRSRRWCERTVVHPNLNARRVTGKISLHFLKAPSDRY